MDKKEIHIHRPAFVLSEGYILSF